MLPLQLLRPGQDGVGRVEIPHCDRRLGHRPGVADPRVLRLQRRQPRLQLLPLRRLGLEERQQLRHRGVRVRMLEPQRQALQQLAGQVRLDPEPVELSLHHPDLPRLLDRQPVPEPLREPNSAASSPAAISPTA